MVIYYSHKISRQLIMPIAVSSIILLGAIHNFIGIGIALGFVLAVVLTKKILPNNHNINSLRLSLAIYWFLFSVICISLIRLPSSSYIVAESIVAFFGMASITYLVSSKLINSDILKVYIIITIVLLITIIGYLANGSFSGVDSSGNIRFQSIFPHANHLSYASATLFAAFILVKPTNSNIIFISIAVILLSSIFLSESAGGIVYLFVLLAGKYLVVDSKSLSLLIFGISIVIAIILSWASGYADAIVERFTNFHLGRSLTQSYEYSFGNQGTSLGWRVSYWAAIFREFHSENRFDIIFGLGPQTTTSGSRVYWFMQKDVHNDYLRTLVEFGYMGLVSLLTSQFFLVLVSKRKLLVAVMIFMPLIAGNSLYSISVFSSIIFSIFIIQTKEVKS